MRYFNKIYVKLVKNNYIEYTGNFIEFNLFNLQEDGFELYLCLAKENIENNLPMQIKQKSVGYEEKITKALYKKIWYD
jgi:hypothetical protein